jgi:hypothetical protein
MRVRKQIPTIRNPHAPMNAYHQGPILTNGALEFVFDKQTAYPLLTFWSPGIPTIQQFDSLPVPLYRAELAVTQAPIYGAGVPAGGTDFQHLISASESDAELGL